MSLKKWLARDSNLGKMFVGLVPLFGIAGFFVYENDGGKVMGYS